MKVTSTLFLILGVFALLAGAVYGVWSQEVAGGLYLAVLGVAFAYLASVTRAAGDEPAEIEDASVSGAHAAGEESAPEVPEARQTSFHASAPSLTPLFFALAAGLIVAGLVFTQWLVIGGGAMLAVVAIVWFVETGHRRAEEEAAKAGHGGGHL